MFVSFSSKPAVSALTAAVVLTGLSLSPAMAGEGGDGGGKGGWKAKIATNEQAALYSPNIRHSLSTTPVGRYNAWRRSLEAQKPATSDDHQGGSNGNR